MTDLFLLSPEGLGVVFQIFMKVVIYLDLYSLMFRSPFKHERPPVYACVRLFACENESLMIDDEDSDRLKMYQYLLSLTTVCMSSYVWG